MHTKCSNLAVAADVTTKKELLALADAVGPEIVVFKTHIDIIADFDWDLIVQLKALAQKHNFLIFEDRKFADIGSTVQQQYVNGIYKIAEWADIVNAYVISGPDIVKALQEVAVKYNEPRGVLLIAQLSSANNLITPEHTQAVVSIAQQYPEFVIGFIAQQMQDKNFLTFTPGISFEQKADNLGQRYNTPEYAIQERGTDIVIVGRAIYHAKDPHAVATEYRQRAWQAKST